MRNPKQNTENEDNTLSELDPKPSTGKKKASIKYSYNRNKHKQPRRNVSAFVLFSNHTRNKLKQQGKEYPNANEMMIKLGEMWRALPKEERRPFEEEAQRDKVRYFQDLENFWKDNPKVKTPTNRTKSNHIKKPCSAYALFLKDVKDEVKAQNIGVKMADILKLISARWKVLDKADKAMYLKMAKVEKEEGKKRLTEHYSMRVEETLEEGEKKKIQRRAIISRKMQGLPKSAYGAHDDQEAEQHKLELEALGIEYSELYQDDGLGIKFPVNPTLANRINGGLSTAESLEAKTEGPEPKEEFTIIIPALKEEFIKEESSVTKIEEKLEDTVKSEEKSTITAEAPNTTHLEIKQEHLVTY